jgi:hypothetical protein
MQLERLLYLLFSALMSFIVALDSHKEIYYPTTSTVYEIFYLSLYYLTTLLLFIPILFEYRADKLPKQPL